MLLSQLFIMKKFKHIQKFLKMAANFLIVFIHHFESLDSGQGIKNHSNTITVNTYKALHMQDTSLRNIKTYKYIHTHIHLILATLSQSIQAAVTKYHWTVNK